MDYAAQMRLRQAVFHWARGEVQTDPESHRRYEAFRARGHSSGRAHTARSFGQEWRAGANRAAARLDRSELGVRLKRSKGTRPCRIMGPQVGGPRCPP